MFTCEVVTTGSAKDSIYRLRYDVYIHEMALPNSYADDQQKVIIDPRDSDGVLFACFDDDQLIGTALGTPACSEQLGEFENIYHLGEISEQERSKTFLFSMLIFLPEYRGSHAVIQCVRTLMLYFFEQGYDVCLLHCYPSDAFPVEQGAKTTNFFVNMNRYCARYGFKELGHCSTNDIGDVVIMRCDLRDQAHLAKCHSPLLNVLYPKEIV